MENSSINEALVLIGTVLQQLQQQNRNGSTRAAAESTTVAHPSQVLPGLSPASSNVILPVTRRSEQTVVPPQPSTSSYGLFRPSSGSILGSSSSHLAPNLNQRASGVTAEISQRFSPYRTTEAANLAAIRQSMPTGRGRSAVGQQRRSNIRQWSRKIIFLGDPREDSVPTTSRQLDLHQANLGPTAIVLNQHASAVELRSAVKEKAIFRAAGAENPNKFNDVNWTLFYAIGSGRCQLLVPFDEQPSPQHIITVRTSTLYARPDVVLCPLDSIPDETPIPVSNQQAVNQDSSGVALTPEHQAVSSGGFRFDFGGFQVEEEMLFLGISSIEGFVDHLRQTHTGLINISVDRRGTFPVDYVLGQYAEDIDYGIKVQVEFVNEAGWDAGGLTKEFFWQSQVALLTYVVGNASLFDGEQDHLLPSADVAVMASGIFKKLARFMVHSCMNVGFFFAGLSGVIKQFVFMKSLENIMEQIEIVEKDLPCSPSRQGLELLMSFQNSPLEFDAGKREQLRSILLEFRISSSLCLEKIPMLVKMLKYAAVVVPRMDQLKVIRDVIRKSQLFKFLTHRKELIDSTFVSIMDGGISIDSIIAAFGDQDSFEKREALTLLYNYLVVLVARNINLSRFVVYLANTPIVPKEGFSVVRCEAGRLVDCTTCQRLLIVPRDISQDKFNQDLDMQLIEMSLQFGRI